MSENNSNIVKTALVPQSIILGISVLWMVISPSDNVLNFFKPSILFIFYGLILGVLLAVSGYLFYFFSKKFNLFNEAIELFEKVLAPVFGKLNYKEIILLSCVSGFVEEVFFRGLLQPNTHLIFASLAFGLLHLPHKKYWIYAVWATLSGGIFGIAFIKSCSLFIPIIAHIVNNICGMFLLRKLIK